MKPDLKSGERESSACARLHLRFGWWLLLGFLSLGLILEGLHALKIGWYLDVAHETRRLMWTLSHAHGTLLALVHIGFGFTVNLLPGWDASSRSFASRSLLGATLLIPLGFFLGGLFFYSGDPGFGALLVPPGGVLLFIAVFLTARAAREFRGQATKPPN